MKYQAVNIYSRKNGKYSDTCGHLHRTRGAAEQCCSRTYAVNVGNVKEIYDRQEVEAMTGAMREDDD